MDSSESYGGGARILSVGIATTGLVTFAYFSLASHTLPADQYSEISLLWIVMFVILSVIYRPIEQLLSRTIAQRRAQGIERSHPLRVPALIQLGFACIFLVIALALRTQIEEALGGSEALYWILIGGVLAYAASYFARGWLAGHRYFGLYGGLVLFESCSRVLFALAAAVGIAHGQTAVALGILAAPFASLLVVPFAARRGTHEHGPADAPALDAAAQGPAAEAVEESASELSLRGGTHFAAAVFVIMLAEQALLNVGPLAADATTTDKALTGIIFNLLLIVRAPLQLFQSVQTSLLPHLTGLETTSDSDSFGRAVRVTVLAICGFALVIAASLLAIGPWAMDLLFGSDGDYTRSGLALIGLAMGLHLAAGTLNQAALARGQAALAALAWAVVAALFTGWMLLGTISDQLLRVELGYFGATLLLSVLLFGLYRRPRSVDV